MTGNDGDATMNIHHSVLYRLWRISFFPIVMLCLFIFGGARALVTWTTFALNCRRSPSGFPWYVLSTGRE